jgi:tRNA (adenine22-N1)-methyltransferase
MQVSKRIQSIVGMVPTDTEVVWDLCCDHGIIGEQFLKLKKVIFIDQVASITEKLSIRLKATDIPSQYKIITSSATRVNYENQDSSTFILAGVGGVLGIEILDQIGESFKDKDYALISVHKNILKMRKYLIERDFKVVSESIVQDNSQFYEMLLISRVKGSTITEIGSTMWDNCSIDTRQSYLNHQIKFYHTKSNFNSEFITILEQYKKIAN